MSLLNLIPGVQPLCLLVREVDVAFLRLAFVPHHVDFLAGLELRIPLVIEHFGDGQHSFRFRADVDDDVSGSELEHRAADHAVFANRLLGFGGEGLERRREVFSRTRSCGRWLFGLRFFGLRFLAMR